MTTTVTETSTLVSFTDSNGNGLEVFDVKDGWADIELPIEEDPEGNEYYKLGKLANEYIEFISGCFTEESNFKKILFEKFGKDPNSEFKGFKVTIEDHKERYINAENSNIFQIGMMFETWTEEYNESIEKKLTDIKEELITGIDRIQEIWKKIPNVVPNYEEAIKEDSIVMSLGFDFIINMENVLNYEHLEFSQAAEQVYKFFKDELNIDVHLENETMKFVEKYWTRGEEIKNWYEKKQKDNFKKFTNLLY